LSVTDVTVRDWLLKLKLTTTRLPVVLAAGKLIDSVATPPTDRLVLRT
jgi:hypothetical protein